MKRFEISEKAIVEKEGGFFANAVFRVRDNGDFAGKEGLGVKIDSANGIGKTREEAEANLKIALKEKEEQYNGNANGN
jgi:hypothetical protein